MEVKNSYDIVDERLGRLYVGRRGFWGLQSKTQNVNRKCPLCGGNKTIKLNGEEYKCPRCGGRTTGELWYSYTQYSLVEYYIDSILISKTDWSIVSIYSVGVDKSCNNASEFKIIFRSVDFGKDNGYSVSNNVLSKDLSKYILTPDEVDFNKLNNTIYAKITDKSTASKVQRILNKAEKERVAEYVEEAKRLKETTTEFSYKY